MHLIAGSIYYSHDVLETDHDVVRCGSPDDRASGRRRQRGRVGAPGDCYLFPIALVAVLYGSNFAFLTSSASAIAATYFLLPPKFSLYIAKPLHIVELGFFVVTALIAGKIVSLLTHDAPLPVPDARNRDQGGRETSRQLGAADNS